MGIHTSWSNGCVFCPLGYAGLHTWLTDTLDSRKRYSFVVWTPEKFNNVGTTYCTSIELCMYLVRDNVYMFDKFLMNRCTYMYSNIAGRRVRTIIECKVCTHISLTFLKT